MSSLVGLYIISIEYVQTHEILSFYSSTWFYIGVFNFDNENILSFTTYFHGMLFTIFVVFVCAALPIPLLFYLYKSGYWASTCFSGMEALGSVDDLLDFSSDIGEDVDDKPRKAFPSLKPKCSDPSSLNPLDLSDPNHSFSVSLMVHFNLFQNVCETVRKSSSMLVSDRVLYLLSCDREREKRLWIIIWLESIRIGIRIAFIAWWLVLLIQIAQGCVT